MKKHLVALMCLIGVGSPADSQITFQKASSGLSIGKSYSIQQTADGGFIIAGWLSTVANQADVFLIKADAYGNMAWSKSFGGTDSDYGYSVQQTADGGYIVAGTTGSFAGTDYNTYLIKTNGSGDTLWTRIYGTIFLEDCYSVRQTNDGGYILTGTTIPFAGSSQQVYLVKIDALGDSVWAKSYEDVSWSHGFSVKQTSDGGYIVAGNAGSGNFDDDIYLLKADANGNLLWAKSFGGTGDDYGSDVEQTADGGYVITGYTNNGGAGYNDIALIKTDSAGNAIWDKLYGNADINESYSVMQTGDGGYILSGRNVLSLHDAYLIKTDANGDTLWTRAYGGAFIEQGYSVRQTTDGGYVLTGTSNAAVYLVKTDGNGNSGCNQGTIPITLATPQMPQTDNSPVINSYPLIIRRPPTMVNSGGTFTTICSNIGMDELDWETGFDIFPNPASEYVYVSFKNKNLTGSLKLENVLGESVVMENVFNEPGKRIDLQNIAQGIYFLNVSDGRTGSCRKLIVE